MAEKEPFWSKPGEGRVCALSLVCKTRSSIFLKVQQALRVLLARSGRGARDTRDGCSHRACLALRASLALTSPVWKTRNSWLEVMFIAEQKDLERFEEGTRTTFVLWGVNWQLSWMKHWTFFIIIIKARYSGSRGYNPVCLGTVKRQEEQSLKKRKYLVFLFFFTLEWWCSLSS